MHNDTEWLGRLAESRIQRVHLVESGAPDDLDTINTDRPGLAAVVRDGGPNVRIQHHRLDVPLVRRRAHPDSVMATIATDPAAEQVSEQERARLQRRFGRVPW